MVKAKEKTRRVGLLEVCARDREDRDTVTLKRTRVKTIAEENVEEEDRDPSRRSVKDEGCGIGDEATRLTKTS